VQKTKKGDVLTIKDADGNKVQLYASEVRALKPGRDLPQSAAEAAEEALRARDVLGRAFKKTKGLVPGPRTTAALVGAGTLGTAATGVIWARGSAKEKKERANMYDNLGTEFSRVPSMEFIEGNPFYSGEIDRSKEGWFSALPGRGAQVTPKPMGNLLEELLHEENAAFTRDDVANAQHEKFDYYLQTGDEAKRFREMVGEEKPIVADLIAIVEVLQDPEYAGTNLNAAQRKKKKQWDNEVRRTLIGFYAKKEKEE